MVWGTPKGYHLLTRPYPVMGLPSESLSKRNKELSSPIKDPPMLPTRNQGSKNHAPNKHLSCDISDAGSPDHTLEPSYPKTQIKKRKSNLSNTKKSALDQSNPLIESFPEKVPSSQMISLTHSADRGTC